MKTKYFKNIAFLVIVILFCLALTIVFPIYINAALMQKGELNNYIKVNSINSKWLDSLGGNASALIIPEYLAPGEELNLNGGLGIKNTGNDAYARFKAVFKLNGSVSNIIDLEAGDDWKQGSDGWYYFVGRSPSIFNMSESSLAIKKMSISKTLNNSNINNSILVELTSEVVDPESTEWQSWAPPSEWVSK